MWQQQWCFCGDIELNQFRGCREMHLTKFVSSDGASALFKLPPNKAPFLWMSLAQCHTILAIIHDVYPLHQSHCVQYFLLLMIPATCPGIPPCNLDYCLMCQWQSCTNYISCIESYEIFLWIVLHDQNMHSTCYDQPQKTTQYLSYPDLWCNQFPVRGTTLRFTMMKETQLWNTILIL